MDKKIAGSAYQEKIQSLFSQSHKRLSAARRQLTGAGDNKACKKIQAPYPNHDSAILAMTGCSPK